jgi:menaquinone-dependent protoporphyrinogen oxidase
MTVLVAYGTTGGGTGEIAGWIADELRAAGLPVHLVPAGEVVDVAGYGALVLGSAVYATGWHTDVRQFGRRFAGRFAGRPVWLFSSGPLDAGQMSQRFFWTMGSEAHQRPRPQVCPA